VSDGISRTILVAELAEFNAFYEWQDSSGQNVYWSSVTPGQWAQGGFWNTMRVIASNRPVEDDGDSTSPGRAQYSTASGTLTRGAGGELGFGGPHNGTFMSVFADGSVHPLSTNIDNTATGVFYRLGNRHDGMTIQDKDYQP